MEAGEDLLTALRREVREEAGAVFAASLPYAVLSTGRPKAMLVYTTRTYELMHDWQPSEECPDRAELDPNQFIAIYHGDKKYMRALIVGAA